MRIISKFHDYYDGINPSSEPVWIRHTQEVDITNLSKRSLLSKEQMTWCSLAFSLMPSPGGYFSSMDTIQMILVGCCGKINPVYRLIKTNKCCTHPDELTDEYRKVYNKELPWAKNFSWINGECYDRLGFDDHQRQYQIPEIIDKISLDIKSPLFMLKKPFRQGISMVINPCLREYHLQSCFDPWVLYQDLEQYLGNQMVMVDSKPCTITDEIRRDKHGFHNMSFKNRGKKK